MVIGSQFYSKGENTPFQGQELIGAPIMTLRSGKIVYPLDEDVGSFNDFSSSLR